MLKCRRKQSDFVGCPPTSEGVSESLPSSAVFTTSPSLSAPKIGSCVEGPFVGAASLATLVELNDDLGSFWQPLGSSTGLSGTKEAWPTSQGISVSKGLEDWMEPLVMPPSDFNRDWIATVFSHSLGSIICRVSWLSVPYGNVSSTYVYPDDPHLQFDWGKAPHTIVYERIYLYVPSWRIWEYIKKNDLLNFKPNHPVPVEGATHRSAAAAGSKERSCSEAKDLGKARGHSIGET